MNWFTKREMYEDFPLHLRRPDHEDVWKFQNQLPKLLNISHHLDYLKQNGLPESDYNLSLDNFDSALCNLFDDELNGIIFLVETFGGERNYWYYISSHSCYLDKIEEIKSKFPTNQIDIEIEDDVDWGFIKSYPFELY